jgi:hypothetical protein
MKSITVWRIAFFAFAWAKTESFMTAFWLFALTWIAEVINDCANT